MVGGGGVSPDTTARSEPSDLDGCCGCEIWDALPPEPFPVPPSRLCKVALRDTMFPAIRSTILASLPPTGRFFSYYLSLATGG